MLKRSLLVVVVLACIGFAVDLQRDTPSGATAKVANVLGMGGQVEVLDVTTGSHRVVNPHGKEALQVYIKTTVRTRIVGGARASYVVDCWVGSEGSEHTKLEVTADSGSWPAGHEATHELEVFFIALTDAFAGNVSCKAG